MYEMRPAAAEDQESIATMVRARMAWMRERGVPDWPRTDEDVNTIASQAADPNFPVWALIDKCKVIGCTTVFATTPEWGWTTEELAQSAYFLATSFTHPSHRRDRPGRLMAWWALDRAAQQGVEWVRRGTFAERLMAYYRDVQGWELVRTHQRGNHTAYLMARRAEFLPSLTAAIKDSAIPAE
ncbi:GNAT family N-acetyltransferase [Streptomyces sp. NPDC057757]|uniref:GNAT family N-acetyltransferase n=1 Tax=Streptomyces sp. NPDC057757 TaxID=3346241 RepID=UPI0036B13189